MIKKFLSLIVVGMLLGANAYAKPVLLACLDEDPSPGSTSNDYFSLDFDNNKYRYLGMLVKANKCALGDCSELTKANRNLPLIYDKASYVSIGVEDQDQYTFNKKDLSLTWASYYMSEIGSSKTFKKVNTIYYYSCKKIIKLPY